MNLVEIMETIPEDAIARQNMLLEMQGREIKTEEESADEEK